MSKKTNISKKNEIGNMLLMLFSRIGIDVPSNFDQIHTFCVEDVEATADPIDWHDGDVAIAFRRWVEAQTPETEN